MHLAKAPMAAGDPAAAATLDYADAAVLRVTMTDSSPTVRVDPLAREGLSVLAPEPVDERSLP